MSSSQAPGEAEPTAAPASPSAAAAGGAAVLATTPSSEQRRSPAEIETGAQGDARGQVTPSGLVPASPSSPVGKIMQFASLYIGDLHPETGEAMLYEAFETVGRVASCRVCRDSVSRKSLGYGYVNYYSVADAEKALDMLNYMKIKGKPCRLMWSQRDPKARRNLNSNVFVKNLDPTVDNKALHDCFSLYGNILSCKVSTDNGGKSKGYGFVHFETEEASKIAIEKVNGKLIGKNQVFVGPFLKREEMEEKIGEQFTNLYVKHLPPAWDEAKLSSVFGAFGEVVSVWHSATEDGKRFALVNYQQGEAARAAVEALHRTDMTSEGLSSVAEAAVRAAAAAAAAAAGEDAARGSASALADADADVEAKAKEKDGKESFVAEEDTPLHMLYVQRAQTRAERKAALEAERKARRVPGKGGGKFEKTGVRLCIKNLGEGTTEQSLRQLFEPFGKVVSAQVRTGEEGKCRGIGFIVFASTEEAAEATKELHLKVVEGKPLNVGVAERRPREPPRGEAGEEGGEEGARRGGGREAAGKAGKAAGKGRGGCGDVFGKGKGAKGAKGGKSGGKDVPPLPFGGGPPVPPQHLPPPPGAAVLGVAYPPGYPVPGFPGGYPAGGYPARPPGPMPYPPFPPSPYAGYAPPLSPLAAHGYPAAAHLPPHLYARPPYGHPQVPMPMPHFAGMPPVLTPMAAAAPGDPREALARMPPQMQKQKLGEQLYSMVSRLAPQQAGKLTGMMLELDNNEILLLLESSERLQKKIMEALRVLDRRS